MNILTIPLLLAIPALVSAFSLNPFSRRGASSLGYYNPNDTGGSLLTVCGICWWTDVDWLVIEQVHSRVKYSGSGRATECHLVWKFRSSHPSRPRNKWGSSKLFSVRPQCLHLVFVSYNQPSFSSFGYSSECLGQHSGTPQQTNLGDANGFSTHSDFHIGDLLINTHIYIIS